ncbi:MAG: hypothetical protein ACK5UI_04150 [Bacteroidota bacterium]
MFRTLIFFLTVLVAGCSYDKYKYTFFEGNWVLINYLDSVQKYRSLHRVNHTNMQEIVLKRHVDSIMFIYNGVEGMLLPFENITSNHIQVKHFDGDSNLSVFMNEEAYYLSYIYKGTQYVFVKPDDLLIDSTYNSYWPTSTERVINSLVLGGIYKQDNNHIPVQFYTNGKITGWSEFDQYEVCIGGDCKGYYDGDVVKLSKGNSSAYFTWEWKNRELNIYQLKQISSPGEKPYHTKSDLAIKLYKIK